MQKPFTPKNQRTGFGATQEHSNFFSGATELVVPDQLRSGVGKPCWYAPGVQRTYDELAEHCDTTIIPARGRRPKDKANVEVGVLVRSALVTLPYEYPFVGSGVWPDWRKSYS
ncbi:MAG: hypothetical protein JXR76_15060 [Deltaproteobacteria bacterium]|nr:hypothetical protein [Deltaproteobacteria bacterium]